MIAVHYLCIQTHPLKPFRCVSSIEYKWEHIGSQVHHQPENQSAEVENERQQSQHEEKKTRRQR